MSGYDKAPTKLPKPVSYDDLYPGRFLKAADLKGKIVTLQITSVDIEELVGDKGEQLKGILSFAKTDKQLALNRTNGECIKGMFGRDVQAWVGKRISIFPAPFKGNLPIDVDECIRVHGSPDIDADKPVRVALPRKKAITMTMRKVVKSGAAPAQAAATAATLPSTEDCVKQLRECGDIEALDRLLSEFKTAFGGEVPNELHAAWNETREQLREEPPL
jgi:hypothetical protein